MSFSTDVIGGYFPALQPCDRISVGKSDVLIHAPGFEDRTMGVIESVVATEEARAFLLDYRPFNPDNRLEDVKEGLRKIGVRCSDEDVLEYDRFDPGDFEARLMKRLATSSAKRVILDVSTMSKLLILLTLGICKQLNVEVVVLYSEAEIYGPSQEEFEDAKRRNEIHRPTIQIISGIHGVVRVSSMASVAMQGQPTAALVFMSFNDSLTQVLLNTVYPSRLFLINGRPPVHGWREEATAWIHDQVRREWEEDNPVEISKVGAAPLPRRVASTLDYRETVLLLIKLYWELSSTHRILLAPAGSKMQTLGCYLVKALHPDIQIEYPSPEGFLPQYSSKIAARWMLNLGCLGDLIGKISKCEREEFLEIETMSEDLV